MKPNKIKPAICLFNAKPIFVHKKNQNLMPHSSLKNKLQPAKKAWKSLVKKLESKLHRISFSKAINAIKTNSDHFLSYCSFHYFHFFNKRSLTTRPYRRHNHRYNTHHYQSCYTENKTHLTNFSPIYIDQLYALETGGTSVQRKHCPGPEEPCSSSSRDKGREEENKGKEKILYSIEDAWREVVAKSPQLRPVDDRAEEFISKFRQEIKLQKDKSIVEFEEMLARGT